MISEVNGVIVDRGGYKNHFKITDKFWKRINMYLVLVIYVIKK